MAVLPIRICGDPVLHTPARPVGQIDDRIRRLAADMAETMHLAPGVGLAAPQVGEPLRMFVWSWTDESGTLHEGVAVDPTLWISPTPVGVAEEDDEEGCLSFPGERFPLLRAGSAILRARDLDSREFEIEATGWLARIFQHEYDHLDGLLYIDRLAHAEHKAAVKIRKKNGWGVDGLSWLPGEDHPEG